MYLYAIPLFYDRQGRQCPRPRASPKWDERVETPMRRIPGERAPHPLSSLCKSVNDTNAFSNDGDATLPWFFYSNSLFGGLISDLEGASNNFTI